jgi:predicted GNAT family acetyltransferase
MAGELMHLNGYTEINAISVHPDYRGKGCAQILVKSLMRMISKRGAMRCL